MTRVVFTRRPRPRGTGARLFGAVLLFLLGLACVHHLPPAPSVPTGDRLQGAVSFGILVDPNAPRTDLPPGEEITPPFPLGQSPPLPFYPARPLAARFGSATCAVRIVVGTEGTVTAMGPSPVIASTPGPYAEDFLAAVRDSVLTWKFFPAQRRRYEQGSDLDGDGKPDFRRILSTEPLPYYIDLRFDFEIVDGKGKVRLGGAESP